MFLAADLPRSVQEMRLSSRCFARGRAICAPVRPPTQLVNTARRAMTTTTKPAQRCLNINNINPHVKEAKYAVRGELAVRAEKYRQKLSRHPPTPPDDSLPFDQVVSANIGNPQQLDQKPITFFRQVLSLVENPELLENADVLEKQLGYGSDVISRAKWLLSEAKSVGAYSQSQGILGVRNSIARFIEQRDGYAADPESIFLSAGASAGVNTLLNVLCAGSNTGVLVPIPQYPLYTATLSLLGAQCVPYYLEENRQWSTDLGGIRSALEKARNEGIDVRAIVVINPGNPTGASLSADDIGSVLKLAGEERLVVMADEVYQTNIFEGEFHSFKKGLRELQKSQPGQFDQLELASLHSISKGMVGECGHRGGYLELVGFDPEVVQQIYKFVSISLCPPVTGQCLVEMMVNPPQPGDPSHALYEKEYNGIFQGLKERALALYNAFKQMEGVECQYPQGSMYLFPTIHLPQRAIEQAKAEERSPDDFYVSRLLDATGVCMVAGSGFGQRENSLHFRTTFLAPGTEWVDRITKFHGQFMNEFRD